MGFPRRRKAQTDGSTSRPDLEPLVGDVSANWLARLLAAIQVMVRPPAVYEMPYLDDGAAATHGATEVGRLDAQSGPADDVTRDPKMPHQDTVIKYVMELGEVIGQRAYAILAALNAGVLSIGFTPSVTAKGWQATSLRTKFLVLVAFVLEAVFGARMAERLAGSHDYLSWAVGLAIAVVLTASALSIAYAVHKQHVGLLRGNGAWVALGIALMGVIFLSLYAWGLGGGAEATPTGGGLSGGSVVGGPSSSDVSTENWALTLIYAALLLFLLASVVCSHLIDLYDEDVARVDSDMVNKKRVLVPVAQKLLAIKLLRQCLVLNEQSKHRARGLLMAYAGGVRGGLSPAINSAWNTAKLENIEIPDPAWVVRIEAEIARLEEDLGLGEQGGPEPPLSLVPAS